MGNQEPITKQQIQEIYKQITDEGDGLPKTLKDNFSVENIRKRGKGAKKVHIATLFNIQKDLRFDVEIAIDLFADNRQVIFDALYSDTMLDCSVSYYDLYGKIKNAILTNIA